MDLKKIQREVYENKVRHGFNVEDVHQEFCLTYGELGEAYDAWRKHQDSVGEELADVVIYILGLCEILDIDLEEELLRKMEINSNRKYKTVQGVKVKENS